MQRLLQLFVLNDSEAVSHTLIPNQGNNLTSSFLNTAAYVPPAALSCQACTEHKCFVHHSQIKVKMIVF